MVTDTRLPELVKQLGRPHAQAVWDAGLSAIGQIDDIVRRHEIDCGFGWVEGYLHLPADGTSPKAAEKLEEEAELASELGFDADLPGRSAPGRHAGRSLRRAGADPSAPVPGGPRQGAGRGGRRHPRAHRGHRLQLEPAIAHGQRAPRDLRRPRDRHSQPARGHRRHHRGRAVPDEALAVHQLCGGGAYTERRGAGRALVGHRRPVPIPPRRAAPRPTIW